MITLLGALYHLSSAAAGRPKPGASLTAFSSLHADPHLGDAVLLFLRLGTGYMAITFLLKLVKVYIWLWLSWREGTGLSFCYFVFVSATKLLGLSMPVVCLSDSGLSIFDPVVLFSFREIDCNGEDVL